VGRCGAGLRRRGDLARGREKGGLNEDVQAEIIAEIEGLIGPGATDGLDLEAIELAARRKALSVAARAIEHRLNADVSDHIGPTLPCSCGQPARYAGRRRKTFTSVLGDLTLFRAYYYCEICHAGFAPRDRALGLEDDSLSPGVLRMVGHVGALVSFAEGREMLHELAGVQLSTKHVERAAEALGREIAEDERRLAEPLAANEPVAQTLYLGMDGTGVPMRVAEVDNRPGKQPDGTSKTREAKLCTVWSAEHRDDKGIPVRDPGSVTYSAAIESAATRDTDQLPSEFAQRVLRETTRRGFDRAARQVIIGDGARWIWNLADEHFPRAIQIVDLYHAKEHLWDVARSIYGPGSDLGAQWAKRRRDELDSGNLDALLHALRAHAESNEDARNCLEYVTRNRHRMAYPHFRSQGLCVGSGVVEAGCKTAIGTRLKRAGMHWTVSGANAIIALRCLKLSGRFDRFWERRSPSARRSA
jgi:hypothetical protein